MLARMGPPAEIIFLTALCVGICGFRMSGVGLYSGRRSLESRTFGLQGSGSVAVKGDGGLQETLNPKPVKFKR